MRKIAFVLILILFVSKTCAANSLEIITYKYPPYTIGDGSGLSELIFDKIAENTGHDIKFNIYPRKRAVQAFSLKDNKKFYMGGHREFPDVPDVDSFLIMRVRTVFVYLKTRDSSFNYTRLKDLKGKTIGATLGNPFDNLFKSLELTTQNVVNLDSNFKKLRNKRIDFWFTLDVTATQMIEKEIPGESNNFGFFEDRETIPLFPVVLFNKNKESAKVHHDLQSGLKAIIKNGDYLSIFEKFYGKNKVPKDVMVDLESL